MRQAADQAQTSRQPVTVSEAADVLGITVDAVRGRIKRGTLQAGKDGDGIVHVHLGAETDKPPDQPDLAADQSQLVERMAGEIEYLRETIAHRDEEIRRRDHLLAAALERIPALEQPSETRESPVTVTEDTGKSTAPPEQQKRSQRPSWWRALFGLE